MSGRAQNGPVAGWVPVAAAAALVVAVASWQRCRLRTVARETDGLDQRLASLADQSAPWRPAGPLAETGGLGGPPGEAAPGSNPAAPGGGGVVVAASQIGETIARVLQMRERFFPSGEGRPHPPDLAVFASLLADSSALATEAPETYREILEEKELILRELFPLMARLPVLMDTKVDSGSDSVEQEDPGATALATVYSSALDFSQDEAGAVELLLADARRRARTADADRDAIEAETRGRLAEVLDPESFALLSDIVGARRITGWGGTAAEELTGVASELLGAVMALGDAGD